MRYTQLPLLGLVFQVGSVQAQQIVNGQIFTPGIAIVNAPQPNTPLGGDTLHISIDVTNNGRLQLPPYPTDSPSAIHNITIFLSNYETGRNLTITNGTATSDNSTLGNIMLQQESSTVKHVNWKWPDCLQGEGLDNDRGLYNISIRQNFRLNGTEQYTIFDLPINVTNSIPKLDNRTSCDSLNNPLLTWEELRASASNVTVIPGSAIQQKNNMGAAATLESMRGGAIWMLVGAGLLLAF